MDNNESLDNFIVCLAQKIAKTYPNNCADSDDYIQTGYLKLLELCRDKSKKRNFKAYAIVAIARAMRNAAIDAMCNVSAPRNAKRQFRQIAELLHNGKTEAEICQELKISYKVIMRLRSLAMSESWHVMFCEPIGYVEPFLIINDICRSSGLTSEDKKMILAQSNYDDEHNNYNRKHKWKWRQRIRPKLMWSGYGI